MKTILIAIVIILASVGIIAFISGKSTKTPMLQDQQISSTISPEPTSEASPSASTTPAASPSASTKAGKAIIRTNKGNIELTLYQNETPKTVSNFATKAKEGFYNNLTFHRVEDWVIQGGDPKGTGTGGGEMDTELNNKPFVVGSLGVARGGNIKISNDAQFFITKQDASWLNGQYTNFGIVTKGMEIVEKIAIGDKILGITVE